MEAVFLNSSADFRNHRKVNRQFISQPSENFGPSSFHGSGGLLYTPPFSLSYPSFPASVSLLNPRQHHYRQQNQPPLLPLPITIPKPYQNNRKTNNRTKHQSLSVKKSKNSKHESVKVSPDSMIMESIKRLGPDPKDLPKDLSTVLSSSPSAGITSNNASNDQVANFSGSVVSAVLSPPPSSLPLPTFSLRPKLSCNAEATAGIDAGATDGLRRILRLR